MKARISALTVALLFSGPLVLLGQAPPTITRQPTNECVFVGGTARFRLLITGDAPFGYQWRHDGTAMSWATNGMLSITNVQRANAGSYDVVVSNPYGSTTSEVAWLMIDPTFTKMPIEPAGMGMWVPYWVDLDGDGWMELVVTGGSSLAVYTNNHDGTLTRDPTHDLSEGVGPWGAYIAWADLDNDGDVDGYAGTTSTPWHLRNDGGGRFTKVSADPWWNVSGIVANGDTPGCADYDDDGTLDLLISSWGGRTKVLHGLGDGRFEVDPASPLALKYEWIESWYWADWDADGRVDLFGATSGQDPPDVMFQNLGQGTFLKITNSPLVQPRKVSISAPWGDYDNDGDLDICITSWDHTNQLYLNLGGGEFVPDPASPRFGASQTIHCASWGDYDNDGWLDLFVARRNGRSSQFFHNRGDGRFEEVLIGSFSHEPPAFIGAWGDYDNDGFLDLTQADPGIAANCLYRNTLRQASCTNHWLKIKLVGTSSNRDGIGATIRVKATVGGSELWQMRQIVCQTHASDRTAHFGLGDATAVDLIRIEWPMANVQELTNVTPDQVYTISEQPMINPPRPCASPNGSITLTRSAGEGLAYQWRFRDADLVGQTNRSLVLTNLVSEQEGHYSVVATSPTATVTNYVHLTVDPTFTKITEGDIVEDRGDSYGCAWGDYDDDGWIDLVVGNGGNEGLEPLFLYRNAGDGTFRRMTTNDVGSIASDRPMSAGAFWGDYDNDHRLDLFVGNGAGPSRLHHNLGDGRFSLLTNRFSVTWGSSWIDVDNDGDLDLFLNVYADRDALVLNNGDQTFAPPLPFRGWSYWSTWGDYDNDGRPDMYGAGDAGASRLFHNEGDGDLAAITTRPISDGAVLGAWGDYDNDGYLDLASSILLHNQGDGTFEKETLAGLRWGGVWGDYDNDGDLDLFVVGNQSSGGKCHLFRNLGDRTFARTAVGSPVGDSAYGVFGSWGDYDNDGFLDLFVTTIQRQANLLYHNNGNSNAWLIVKLRGTTSNATGVGAKVRVLATIHEASTWQMRQISGGMSDDLRAHFGLGNATHIACLRIEWPSGTVQTFTNVVPRQILTVVEPRRPRMTGEVMADGSCCLHFTTEVDRVYELQASEDLSHWTPVTQRVGTGTDMEVVDPSLHPARVFYRIVSP